ncbi:glycerol-3-phosphate dehydrogenase [Pontixanthobacter gangjinensis]|uniref:Glycerol-3-phosphate dehydrogenase n=1 Tax=Pontixanthobacter gangjinensis TaxID=1028742 RepID=A0A6I4SPJ0_9SPHN|nr:glycerol-3-phosphate dehydrogenase [Pontixanthobacter gangjinensis]MXO57723.1 glycerol-3-phosphate dehydrogenase [Pontixanthobacter gangjinensis]
MIEAAPYDLLVIGGGINGVGIARDAAGRGAKVMLVEKDDLASHTSSASTKLVHGGLRYLEHYEFRLVRESLIERERLLGMAPHIIWPLRFVLPHDKGLRPAWLLRLGLFLYDHIGGRKQLPATKTVDLRQSPHGEVLEDRLVKGFEYSDCWVEDSRLVVLNAVDAAERGADIRTRTECTGLERRGPLWVADLKNDDRSKEQVSARAVVNAAGPWVDTVLGRANPGESHQNLRLVKGSHLIFRKLYDGDHCYIFQNKDDRIVFAIPYERDFTLVGTTDVAFTGDPDTIAISDEESAYICDAINEYLKTDVSPDQAVWSYSGVRPLYDDHSANNSTVTRDYVFELDAPDGAPPILSIFGGKITTYRKLGEHALHKLSKLDVVPAEAWTEGATLPGGDIVSGGFDAFVSQMQSRFSWCPDDTMLRLCRAYGTLVTDLIGDADSWADLGQDFGAGLTEQEVNFLIVREFSKTADDILWRRSKLGLHMTAEERAALTEWFGRCNPVAAS